jgi:hypothetical protein
MATIQTAMAAALACASAACYVTKQVSFEDFGSERVHHVWVTRPDQSVLVLREAEVAGDKLRGFVNGELHELPASELQQIKIRKLAAARTVSLIGGGALAFAVVAVLASGHNEEFDSCAGNPKCMAMPSTAGP